MLRLSLEANAYMLFTIREALIGKHRARVKTEGTMKTTLVWLLKKYFAVVVSYQHSYSVPCKQNVRLPL